MNLDDAFLISLCGRDLPLSDYSLFIYGSSSYALEGARDIDMVAVTSDPVEPRVATREMPANMGGRGIHLYIVSKAVFAEDVAALSYGGYYAHKFLFSFRALSKSGAGVDAPRLFWEQELNRLLQLHTYSNDITENIRLCHAFVLRFRPTVARSMAKYVRSSEAAARLLGYVSALVGDGGLPWRSDVHEGTRTDNHQKACWLFWSEYAKHKTGGEVSHEVVHRKMHSSLNEEDTALARDYTRARE